MAERVNRVRADDDFISPQTPPPALPKAVAVIIDRIADRIRQARNNGKPVIAAFGAHTIKNGLGPVLAALIEEDRLTHLATNGAGIIHDWEFAFLGASSEHVQDNVARGLFGNWEETGFYINLALNVGAYEGRGYGESVGALIENGGLDIPSSAELCMEVNNRLAGDPAKAAAAADLLDVIQRFGLQPGRMDLPHPYRKRSLQAAAYRCGVPLTGHPMFGHDVIYNHPMNHGAALGRAAQRDFLRFAHAVSQIDGGVYLSIGSAVMSPMIFEKSMSMAQNLARQEGRHIDSHFIAVVDLAACDWDWNQGEPPEEHPAYYLRYNKSFSRMGGDMYYLQCDNRDFLLALYHRLRKTDV